jgi:hypothetical protein
MKAASFYFFPNLELIICLFLEVAYVPEPVLTETESNMSKSVDVNGRVKVEGKCEFA